MNKFIVGSAIVLVGCLVLQALTIAGLCPAIRIEHGWRTWNVEAIRYKSDIPFIGYNAGLTFPHLSDYRWDDAELVDCIKMVPGVYVYEGGEYPGEPMFLVIKGAQTSKAALDMQLHRLLPAMDICAARAWWRQWL